VVEGRPSGNIKHDEGAVGLAVVASFGWRVLHGDSAVGLLSSRVPGLHSDLAAIIKDEGFGGKLDCDGGHDVGGRLVAHKSVGNMSLAGGGITHENNCVYCCLLFTKSRVSSSSACMNNSN
jgi:hypothetical protein